MDSCARVPDAPDPDAAAFVRFCRGRRRVAWPELYDEMWAVASRGLFRGWSFGELEGRGIGFCLFQMPALAALVARVIAEEPRQPSRRAAGAAPGSPRRGLAVIGGSSADEVTPSASPAGQAQASDPMPLAEPAQVRESRPIADHVQRPQHGPTFEPELVAVG